jgi:hypothetical protein
MAVNKERNQRSAADRLLAIYLNDHLALSIGGRELAERCLSENPEGTLGAFLRRLIDEIEEEQRSVHTVLERTGGAEDPAKKNIAWVAEKIARFKLNGQLTGYSDLSRLEELETLVVGIRGKMALWGTLEEAGGRWLAGIDLQRLQANAARQQAEAEELRRGAARRAFHEADPRPG